MRRLRACSFCGGSARRIATTALAIGLELVLGGSALAVTVDFEGVPVGTDAATLGAPGVAVAGGLVLDENLVGILLGYPATGTWNTTPGGSQGLLNSLASAITLTFSVPISLLRIDVLALPDAAGNPGSVLLLGTDGGFTPGAYLDPNTALPSDSGLPEGTLSIGGQAITSAILCPHDLANPGTCLASSEPTTFWIDQIRFEPIPEPATAVLLGLMLGALAAHRRTA